MTTTPDSPQATAAALPNVSPPAGLDSLADQVPPGAHSYRVGEGTIPPQAIEPSKPILGSPAGPDSLAGQPGHATQCAAVSEGIISPQAISDPMPIGESPAGPGSLADQMLPDARSADVGEGPDLRDGQPADDAHKASAAAERDSLADHGTLDGHCRYVGEGSDLRSGQARFDPRRRCAAAEPDPLADHVVNESHAWLVGEGPDLRSGQDMSDPHIVVAAAETDSLADHGTPDPHTGPVGEGPDLRSGQRENDAQVAFAAAETHPRSDPRHFSLPKAQAEPIGPLLSDPTLAMLAQVVDDLEATRIANKHRLRNLTLPVDEPDADGVCRGLGLPENDPSVAVLLKVVGGIKEQEDIAIKALRKALAKHPLGPWMKAQRGIGEKQGARLLAAIGDPAWNYLHGRPRTVSELWAYCGYHVVDGQAPRRMKGRRANWSHEARTRAFLVAESCMKQPPGSRYRDVYDQARAKYADAVHVADCQPCAGKSKSHPPRPAGSPLSDGHKHARALRAIAKAVLRDMWVAAREVHGVDAGGHQQEAA